MVRLLQESDRERALAFLDRDHECNLIMIYDLQHFGLKNRGHSFQGDYYGVYGRDDDLGGIAVLYNAGSIFIYAPQPELLPELVERMVSLERKPSYVIGHVAWVGPLLDALAARGLRPRGVEEQEYMVLTPRSFRPRLASGARLAESRDLEELIELNRAFQIEYFGSLTIAEEALGNMLDMRIRDQEIAVTEAGGRIVSKAEVVVRTSRAALIGGVFSLPDHRGKGHSFSCMSLLCRETLERVSKACLNVAKENLPARHVYRELGFEKLCDYRIAYFAQS